MEYRIQTNLEHSVLSFLVGSFDTGACIRTITRGEMIRDPLKQASLR